MQRPSPGLNRRDFLKVLGVGAGTALLSREVTETLASPNLPPPLAVASAAQDQSAHVLNRVTFGPRPGQVDAVRKQGIRAYLEQQLNPQSVQDDAVEERLKDYITLDMTPVEMTALGPGKAQAEAIAELDSATVIRAVYSERQLYEIMVNFWSEHFSIWHLKEQCKILKTSDDRDVIRKHALGKFRDLLGASAKSPAMLLYLDNAKSQKAHPNENYAREVMELHTITIGNYTETDVKEVARCFTGWTVQGPRGANPGEFIFNPKQHDDGPKTVLGHQIPAGGGIQDGETVLDILASHPVTAKLIAIKLCTRFIADDPPAEAIDAATNAFLNNGGDIPTVLRAIFDSPSFLTAPPKFKRPFEYLVSLYRAFDVDLAPLDTSKVTANGIDRKMMLSNGGMVPLALLKMMGHLPFDHITPDGYSDIGSNWIGNMLLRWNAAIVLVAGAMPGAKVDLAGLVQAQGVELKPQPVLDYFAEHLLGRQLSQAEVDAIWGLASKQGQPDLTTEAGRLRMRAAIALIAASPAFQYR